jgi:hypothetical protein
MNFVTLFRPLRVVPNTLDPSLNGLDWGAMSKMFSGCLSPASTPGCLVSVMAPPCPLTCHPSVTSRPGPSTKYDPTLSANGEEEHVDTAYSNMIGPSDAAEQWGDKGGKKVRMEVLRAWIGTGKRKDRGRTRRCVDEDEDEDAVLGQDANEHGLVAGPSRLTSSSGIAPKTPKKYARSDDSGYDSDEGGSDDHARIAWKLFGVGEFADACKTWVSPSPQSRSQVQAEAVVDVGTLPTPTSSPLLRARWLDGSNNGKERAIERASQSGLLLTMPVNSSLGRAPTEIVPLVSPNTSRLTSFVSACTSPFVSFEDIRVSGQSLEEQTNEAVGSASQPFTCLDNVVLSDPFQDLVSSPHLMQHHSQNDEQAPRLHGRNLFITKDVGNVGTKADVENVGEVPPLKRRRTDREELEVRLGEKGDVPEFAGLAQSGLTRMPTVPSEARVDDKEADLPPTSSVFEVEDILGARPRSSPAPAVTATPIIPFPVRKRIEYRANYAGKAASLGGSGRGASSPRKGIKQVLAPGLASCSTSAIAPAPVLAVERTSTAVRAETLSAQTSAATLDVSTRTSDAPVSPRTAARRAERAERRRITEKLRLARPDLVIRAQSSRRGSGSRGLARAATSALAVASTYAMDTGRREVSSGNGMDVTEQDAEMDWEKSHQLAEKVREALKRGEHASEVLPRLRCLEQWYAERA